MRLTWCLLFLVGLVLVICPHKVDPVGVYRWGYFAGACMGAAVAICLADAVRAIREDIERERRLGEED